MVISGQDEGFLYVTFDIIEEGVIEVKKFGACARRMRRRQQAGGSPATSSGQAGSREWPLTNKRLISTRINVLIVTS